MMPIELSPWKYVKFLKLLADVMEGLIFPKVRTMHAKEDRAKISPIANFPKMLVLCSSVTYGLGLRTKSFSIVLSLFISKNIFHQNYIKYQ